MHTTCVHNVIKARLCMKCSSALVV